jgi:ferredoxin
MAKMTEVEIDLCIGCGSCIEVCPKVFELMDDKSWVVGPNKCGACNCQEAIDVSPTGGRSRWSSMKEIK